jgi:hypothetical protein
MTAPSPPRSRSSPSLRDLSSRHRASRYSPYSVSILSSQITTFQVFIRIPNSLTLDEEVHLRHHLLISSQQNK